MKPIEIFVVCSADCPEAFSERMVVNNSSIYFIEVGLANYDSHLDLALLCFWIVN